MELPSTRTGRTAREQIFVGKSGIHFGQDKFEVLVSVQVESLTRLLIILAWSSGEKLGWRCTFASHQWVDSIEKVINLNTMPKEVCVAAEKVNPSFKGMKQKNESIGQKS